MFSIEQTSETRERARRFFHKGIARPLSDLPAKLRRGWHIHYHNTFIHIHTLIFLYIQSKRKKKKKYTSEKNQLENVPIYIFIYNVGAIALSNSIYPNSKISKSLFVKRRPAAPNDPRVHCAVLESILRKLSVRYNLLIFFVK